MPGKIAVIEDDEDLCLLLEYNLRKNGYAVDVIPRLEGALRGLLSARPDLILLDVMLPDGDGFEFCRRIRAEEQLRDTPVLFLTARGAEVDRVIGLEIGGDDYIVKPFSPRELLARVKAHLRRKQRAAPGERKTAGPLQLDSAACRVFLRGREVLMTAMEFRLLEFLFSHPSKVFSRDQLLRSIWGDGCHVTPRNVDVHIRRLREHIEETPDKPKWIQTVRGFGYRFELPQ